MLSRDGALSAAAKGRTGWWLALGVILVSVLLLNLSTPMLVDDHFFAFVVGTDDRVDTIADVFRSQVEFYNVWSGRSVTHFLAQSLILIGDPLARIVNASGFALLVVLVYLNAHGLRSPRPSLLVVIALAIWFATPDFGQAVLWLTGAANYMWGAILVLGALLPFRLYLDGQGQRSDGPLAFVGAGILGLLAGWSNENTAPVVIVVMVAYAWLFYRKGRGVPAWVATAIAGAAAGMLIMLLAPGNSVRLGSLPSHTGPVLSPDGLVSAFVTVTHALFLNNLFALTVLFLVCTVFASRFGESWTRESMSVAAIYLGAAYLATYAMVFSPHFPGRAWFGIIVLAVTAIGVVYSSLNFSDEFVVRIVSTAVVGTALLFSVQFAYVYFRDVSVTDAAFAARAAHIEERKESGETAVLVEPVRPRTKYNGAWGLAELSENPEDWPNYDIARYYGIESIALKANALGQDR